jgi:hypothetical protein
MPDVVEWVKGMEHVRWNAVVANVRRRVKADIFRRTICYSYKYWYPFNLVKAIWSVLGKAFYPLDTARRFRVDSYASRRQAATTFGAAE